MNLRLKKCQERTKRGRILQVFTNSYTGSRNHESIIQLGKLLCKILLNCIALKNNVNRYKPNTETISATRQHFS